MAATGARVTSHHRNRGNSRDRRNRRTYLWAHRPHVCYWCQVSVEDRDWDVDRLVCGASYGFSAPYPNVVIACVTCNRSRQDTPADVYAEKVASC